MLYAMCDRFMDMNPTATRSEATDAYRSACISNMLFALPFLFLGVVALVGGTTTGHFVGGVAMLLLALGFGLFNVRELRSSAVLTR